MRLIAVKEDKELGAWVFPTWIISSQPLVEAVGVVLWETDPHMRWKGQLLPPFHFSFFWGRLLNCQAVHCHCSSPKWGISEVARKELLVPWVCLSSEIWFAFYGHLSDSRVGGEFTVLALLPPHSLSCV